MKTNKFVVMDSYGRIQGKTDNPELFIDSDFYSVQALNAHWPTAINNENFAQQKARRETWYNSLPEFQGEKQ